MTDTSSAWCSAAAVQRDQVKHCAIRATRSTIHSKLKQSDECHQSQQGLLCGAATLRGQSSQRVPSGSGPSTRTNPSSSSSPGTAALTNRKAACRVGVVGRGWGRWVWWGGGGSGGCDGEGVGQVGVVGRGVGQVSAVGMGWVRWVWWGGVLPHAQSL